VSTVQSDLLSIVSLHLFSHPHLILNPHSSVVRPSSQPVALTCHAHHLSRSITFSASHTQSRHHTPIYTQTHRHRRHLPHLAASSTHLSTPPPRSDISLALRGYRETSARPDSSTRHSHRPPIIPSAVTHPSGRAPPAVTASLTPPSALYSLPLSARPPPRPRIDVYSIGHRDTRRLDRKLCPPQIRSRSWWHQRRCNTHTVCVGIRWRR
jgi:hypothetical protein